MKKAFFLLAAIIVSTITFANNNARVNDFKIESSSLVNSKSSSYTHLGEVTLNKSDLTLPLVIQISAPSETIIEVNGPIRPNTNWFINNGILTITFTKEYEIIDLYEGGVFYIEVETSPLRYYAIRVIVN